MNGTGIDPAASRNRAEVSVKICLPDTELRPYVTFFYAVVATKPVNDFLYPEWGNVRFSIDGDMVAILPGSYPPGPQPVTLFGPTDRAAFIQSTGGHIAGFGLTPLGWNRFIDIPASELANRIQPLGPELGIEGYEFFDQVRHATDDDAIFSLFNDILLTRLQRTPANSPALLRLDDALRSCPRDVAEFQTRAGMSARTLLRACLRLFGFTPQRLLRKQRFLDTLGQIRTKPDDHFINLLDDRYFDQSHFIRDFREFMGMTPRSYLKTPRDIFRVAAAEQAERGITLSFRLPPSRAEAVSP